MSLIGFPLTHTQLRQDLIIKKIFFNIFPFQNEDAFFSIIFSILTSCPVSVSESEYLCSFSNSFNNRN